MFKIISYVLIIRLSFPASAVGATVVSRLCYCTQHCAICFEYVTNTTVCVSLSLARTALLCVSLQLKPFNAYSLCSCCSFIICKLYPPLLNIICRLGNFIRPCFLTSAQQLINYHALYCFSVCLYSFINVTMKFFTGIYYDYYTSSVLSIK